MNNAEKLEKLADYFRSIGCLYGELVPMTEQIERICAEEEGGCSARVFEQETLWQRLQDLKHKTQETPPPFLPPVDGYGLPPIPEGAAPVLEGMHDAGALPTSKNEVDSLGEIAFSCWRQLECDLIELQGDLFGGKEVWITGESAYPLIQLEAKNSARREIYHQRKARLDAWAEVARKMLADEALNRAAAAEMARERAEGARLAEKVRADRAEAERKKAEREKRKAVDLEGSLLGMERRLGNKMEKTGRETAQSVVVQLTPGKGGKSGKPRRVYLPETLLDAFREYEKKLKEMPTVNQMKLAGDTVEDFKENGRDLGMSGPAFRKLYNIWVQGKRPQTAEEWEALHRGV